MPDLRNCADSLPCSAPFQSFTHRFTQQTNVCALLGFAADVHSKIIASLIRGPPHDASSRGQAICSKEIKNSVFHWRVHQQHEVLNEAVIH